MSALELANAPIVTDGGVCAKPLDSKGSPVNPSQFQVNEAWIAFKLNDAPIRTAQEGSFNCICLMDAASCFIVANTFFPTNESEPSTMEVRRLLEKARAHRQELPAKLFIPTDQFPTNLPKEAERRGIAVVRVPEGTLIPFIREAREGFKQYSAARRSAQSN